MEERKTSIIRTLPYRPGGKAKGGKVTGRAAYSRMVRGLRALNKDPEELVWIALSAAPRQEVLNCYLLVDGRVRWRARVVEVVPNTEGAAESWDGHTIAPKFWCIVGSPAEKAPREVRRRGFQGFRYTPELW